jgi:6-phosphogluconate dehydrogenase
MAQLGMVDLGRMGAGIVRRLMRDGRDCVVYDQSATRSPSSSARARRARRRSRTLRALNKPRAAWARVAAAVTGAVVDQLADLMDQLPSAMRQQFGGHLELSSPDGGER